MTDVQVRVFAAAVIFIGGLGYSFHWDDIAIPVGYSLALLGLVLLAVEYVGTWRRNPPR